MAVSYTIKIDDRTAEVLRGARRIDLAFINRVVARSGQNFTRAHFFALNSSRPNMLGGKRTNFYAQAARGTTGRAVADGAIIGVNQVGIRQRIEGGTIVPKAGKKFLTIPARAEAHGRRAREFNNLTVLFGRGGVPIALVEADATRVKKTRKGFEGQGETGGGVMYWLVPRVVQRPDASVRPNYDGMKRAMVRDLRSAIGPRADGTGAGTGGGSGQ